MYPFLQINSIEIPMYAALITIGFIIGFIILIIRSKFYPISRLHVVLSFIFILIGLMLGAKILYAIVQIPSFIKNIELVKQYPVESLQYAFYGFVFYGGLSGAFIALKLFCFQFDKPFLLLTNLYTPVIPLVHAFGRMGCFCTGCCYGIEYHGILTVNYPDNAIIEGVNYVSRFPVQLLESVLNILLFLMLLIYTRKSRKEGSVLGIYLISYGVIRFCMEFLRGDILRGIFLGISTSQWISIILIPLGIYLLVRKNSKHQNFLKR